MREIDNAFCLNSCLSFMKQSLDRFPSVQHHHQYFSPSASVRAGTTQILAEGHPTVLIVSVTYEHGVSMGNGKSLSQVLLGRCLCQLDVMEDN